tara:strand:- start:357 stop:713 length:357 start_codon:yes stop_codon:yes gene_type:complete
MENTIFYLSSCNTCIKILNDLKRINSFKKVDIKINPLNEIQLNKLFKYSKSFEKLFNKRCQLIKKMDLDIKILKENDYKNLILSHYTFLKRPVILFNYNLFIGNNKETLAELNKALNE